MGSPEKDARIKLIIQGRVQGVGFRPFIWRLARELGLTGFVQNTSAGVCVEVQGSPSALASFERRVKSELPPLALISAMRRSQLDPAPDESSFEIVASTGHAGQNVLVSPDIGLCPECLEDLRDPGNFRHSYPFTNCVNCGPRFSITSSIPYDRASTTMACFELCGRCGAEYSDPANRRFHAQPIACPSCGPAVWHVDQEDLARGQSALSPAKAENAIERAVQDILAGKTVAIKGLGGFQLACNARDPLAIQRLRERKRRPHKALAVMSRDVASAALFCSLEPSHIRLLESPEKPIVLCPKKVGGSLPGLIAPDVPHIGVMLPYTPLHAILFDRLHERGLPNPVLVMTSANPAGEPICLGNREALRRLPAYADSWLLHNRDILVRVDDSVLAVNPAQSRHPLFLRRARGYVPIPQKLPASSQEHSVLGMGGDLKGSFCLLRSNEAFMSQHIGDLDNLGNLNFFEEALTHMRQLLECAPRLIVHDSHPDFASTRLARELARKDGIPLLPLQHHAAHAASVLAENTRYAPALALCLDGTGLGEDKSIWGGELIYMDLSKPSWQRVGSFTTFPLAGAENAIRQPWRIAFGLDWLGGKLEDKSLDKEERALAQILAAGLNCPMTSSCGRLFDAAAAGLGLCRQVSYEGQAAIRLMNAAWEYPTEKLPVLAEKSWLSTASELPRIDSAALYAACLELFRKNGNVGEAAAFFHASLADALVELCLHAAKKYNIREIGLSGGVMQNFLLLSMLQKKLLQAGLQPLSHKELPPGDGGLAFGQAVWGRQMLNQA